MTQEEKYKEALLEARAVLEPCLKYSKGKVREALDSIDKELERFESEDEKIRKLLVWQVHRNIEDETNDLAQSVYDGIKGHDPDLEESIEDWKRCLAWLEKQKESHKRLRDKTPWIVTAKEELAHAEERLQANLEELHRIRAEKEKQKEQKPVSISCGHENDAEWSEEDKRKLNRIYEILGQAADEKPFGSSKRIIGDKEAVELQDFIKLLRPSWKPSEEQMEALHTAMYLEEMQFYGGLKDKLRDLYVQLKKL
jgi:hypothetical protein